MGVDSSLLGLGFEGHLMWSLERGKELPCSLPCLWARWQVFS